MDGLILPVNTAIVVPVNLLHLVDDTDFKTPEEAVAYNAAGMDLNWNFVTLAGAVSQTNVVPTTAGVYDWTHAGNAMYNIEIPASGGGSINNDTEGYGWFTGVCTGVMPWRGPVIELTTGGYSRANIKAINDSTAAAIRAALIYGRATPGTVTNSPNAPTKNYFEASDITEATDDHFAKCGIMWTSGVLAGQFSYVLSYRLNGSNGEFTITPTTDIPGNGDTFIVL